MEDSAERTRARWMSMLLSALTGTAVTPAQLLGEEATELADRTADAEREAEALLAKMAQHGVPSGKPAPKELTDG